MLNQQLIAPQLILETLAHARWQQSLALYETWTEIWQSNPTLAQQAGARVNDLMSTLSEVQRRNAQDLQDQP
jgi:hypothetical protein